MFQRNVYNNESKQKSINSAFTELTFCKLNVFGFYFPDVFVNRSIFSMANDNV